MTAVVIVTFGRRQLTTQTLDSLFGSNYDRSKVTVTVVDNGSQPELVSALVDYRDRIDNLVLLKENKGKPYAWNLGAQIAQEKCIVMGHVEPKYFLFCDNDLTFKDDWHKTLVAAFEEHGDLPLCAISGLRWPGHPATDIRQGQTTQINAIRWPPGCCVFMSAESFKANGPWDTKRKIRTVDTTYFRNAVARGYYCASIHPESVIETTGTKHRSWHIGNGTPLLLP